MYHTYLENNCDSCASNRRCTPNKLPRPGPTGPAGGSFRPAFGVFPSSEDTVLTATPLFIPFDEPTLANGVSLGLSPVNIVVTNPGTYVISVSLRLEKILGSSPVKTHVWLRVGSTDVPNSSSVYTLSTGDLDCFTEFIQTFTAGQTFSIGIQSEVTVTNTVSIASDTSVVPNALGVVLNIYRIG